MRREGLAVHCTTRASADVRLLLFHMLDGGRSVAVARYCATAASCHAGRGYLLEKPPAPVHMVPSEQQLEAISCTLSRASGELQVMPTPFISVPQMGGCDARRWRELVVLDDAGASTVPDTDNTYGEAAGKDGWHKDTRAPPPFLVVNTPHAAQHRRLAAV